MDLNLAGRTVLVTGASKGIGLSVSQWFAREGCRLRMAARSGDLLARGAEAIREAHGVEVQTCAVDLSNDEGRARLTSLWPETDVLINNAGDIPGGSLEDVDQAAWRAGWDLKVFGYIELTRHYYAKMKARRKGVIINIIGSAGERPSYNYIAGALGNLSLMGFSLAMGTESTRYGVRIIGFNPGPTLTDRVTKLAKVSARKTLGDENRYEETFKHFPFGRPATCDEVSPTVVFLASDLSSYTSGTIVSVHGGTPHRPPA